MGNEALGRKQRISNDAWIEAMTVFGYQRPWCRIFYRCVD